MVCSWALARTVDRAKAQLQALIITISTGHDISRAIANIESG
ncbi:hypothetical protein ACP6PL_17020 [Dapis sp. BLCC M126]